MENLILIAAVVAVLLSLVLLFLKQRRRQQKSALPVPLLVAVQSENPAEIGPEDMIDEVFNNTITIEGPVAALRVIRSEGPFYSDMAHPYYEMPHSRRISGGKMRCVFFVYTYDDYQTALQHCHQHILQGLPITVTESFTDHDYRYVDQNTGETYINRGGFTFYSANGADKTWQQYLDELKRKDDTSAASDED